MGVGFLANLSMPDAEIFMRRMLPLFLLVLCNASIAEDDASDVAHAFSRAANFIYYTGFEHSSVTSAFSEKELRILDSNREALNLMIREALGVQDSVGGAMLTAHFGIDKNLDLLRYQILEPGRAYGWEGSYMAGEDWYMSDEQYVYHSRYIEALESITGKPVHEVIELTERERNRINELAADPSNEHWEWAMWISRKLGL